MWDAAGTSEMRLAHINERIGNELADYSSPIPLFWPISSHPYMFSSFSLKKAVCKNKSL